MSKEKAGVVVLPTNALQEKTNEQKPYGLSLHPFQATDSDEELLLASLYVLKRENETLMIAEVVKYSPSYGSWFFVPNETDLVPNVCSNGNMTFVTQIDPLFCVLILLDLNNFVDGKAVFQPLEALCTSFDGTNFAELCPLEQIQLLCESTEAAGTFFYRLNEEKVLDWLQKKYDAVLTQPDIRTDDALEFVQQYLNPRWRKTFKKHIKGSTETEIPDAELQNAKDLALSTMLEDARTTNEAMRSQESSTFTKKKTAKKSTSKKPSASSKVTKQLDKSWWTSALKPAKKNDSQPKSGKAGEKRKRRQSSLK